MIGEHRTVRVQAAIPPDGMREARQGSPVSQRGTLQTSHSYVTGTLPIAPRQEATFSGLCEKRAKAVLKHVKRIAQEIDVPAPAVKRGGGRPDNCEHASADSTGELHLPLDWSFSPSQLLVAPGGRTILS
jgi:hypothetical protein